MFPVMEHGCKLFEVLHDSCLLCPDPGPGPAQARDFVVLETQHDLREGTEVGVVVTGLGDIQWETNQRVLA